ncbi:MAG TPA: DUF87 domain-containing protein [Acidiferrobacteraceae bacterium]|nr:DUF87 domain-containing protein [Acidiferrobacteraceae bacterium]
MIDITNKQSTRLWILIAEVVILVVASRFAFEQWFPPLGEKGFWFYTALLGLLLGSRLVTPFYSRPVDAIVYAIPAGIALLLINNWANWNISEKVIFVIAFSYCALVVTAAFISILIKDSTKEWVLRLSNSFRLTLGYLGSPKPIYGVLILFAWYTFHRESYHEMFWIGLAGVFAVVTSPIEIFARLVNKLLEIWKPRLSIKVIGEVIAYQTPNIVLIRQIASKHTKLGTPLLIKDPHAPEQIGMALDYVGRDAGMLLRAIELGIPKDTDNLGTVRKGVPVNSVVNIEIDAIDQQGNIISEILHRSKEIVGIVAPETSIERLYFEVVQVSDLEEGRLVETYIGDNHVLYQVINGLTKEDIVQQKNKYGYARAQAQKVGIWDDDAQKFLPAKWLPSLNAPVFLKTVEEYQQNVDAIGHFPETNYTVGIKNIHELVTHNTAILGILGVGKSMLAIELVERMMAAGIKVICIDMTDEYAEELGIFYDEKTEHKLLDELDKIGSDGKTNIKKNVEEGGSINQFSEEIENHISDFMCSGIEQKLKIYNPSRFEVWRQDSKPYQDDASMASLTPTEIAKIISEATLNIVRQMGRSKEAKVCIVYEEAHSLVPEWNSVAVEGDKTATNGTARAILQGRKYGMGCLLITQRTANVTKTILNQCNTVFAMRTFDDTGKGFLSNYIGKDYTNILSSLQARHAIFFGKASTSENPVLLRLNDREDFTKTFRQAHPPPELQNNIEEPEGGKNPENANNNASGFDDDIPF